MHKVHPSSCSGLSRVTVLGAPQSGRSSLIARFLEEDKEGIRGVHTRIFHFELQQTRHNITQTYDKCERIITKHALDERDGVIGVFALNNQESLVHLTHVLNDLKLLLNKQWIPFMIVGTKADLDLTVDLNTVDRLCSSHSAPFLSTSAQTGRSVLRAFTLMSQLIKHHHHLVVLQQTYADSIRGRLVHRYRLLRSISQVRSCIKALTECPSWNEFLVSPRHGAMEWIYTTSTIVPPITLASTLTMIGEPGVGMQSLLARHIEGRWPVEPFCSVPPTFSRAYPIGKGDEGLYVTINRLHMLDRIEHNVTLQKTSVLMGVFSLADPESLSALSANLRRVRQHMKTLPIILVGTMAEKPVVSRVAIEAVAIPYDAPFVATSSKMNANVDEAFFLAAKLMCLLDKLRQVNGALQEDVPMFLHLRSELEDRKINLELQIASLPKRICKSA